MRTAEYRIFELLNNNDSLEKKKLAMKLNVSQQTLKKYIQRLNDDLIGIAQIVEKNQKYFLKVTSYVKLASFKAYTLKRNLDFNNPRKRQAYTLLQLLEANGYIILDDLAEMLLISKGTLVRDMNEIRIMLRGYGAQINSASNNGIRLQFRHDYQVAFMLRNLVCDYYDIYPQMTMDEKSEVTRIIHQHISNEKVVSLIIRHIKVLNFLHLHGHTLSGVPKGYQTLVSDAKCAQLLSELKQFCVGELNHSEGQFLLMPFNFTVDMVDEKKLHTRALVIETMLTRLFAQLVQNMNVNLNVNRMMGHIKYHIVFMLNRCAASIFDEDYFSRELAEKYPIAVDLAIMATNLLEEHLDIKVPDSELSYFALYFQMELDAHNKKQRHKIAIVGEVNRSIKELIKMRMQDNYQDKLAFDSFKSAAEFKQVANDYLLAFSTVPIKVAATTPVVRVKSIFRQAELTDKVGVAHIAAGIENGTIVLRIRKFSQKVEYFPAVEKLIAEEIKQGQLNPAFKATWKKRELKLSNVFGNGVAIPHNVDTTGNQRILVTIGLLNKAVKHNGKTVKVIFLVGVPQQLTSDLQKQLIRVYNFIFLLSKNELLYNNLLSYDSQLPLSQLTEAI